MQCIEHDDNRRTIERKATPRRCLLIPQRWPFPRDVDHLDIGRYTNLGQLDGVASILPNSNFFVAMLSPIQVRFLIEPFLD
jgi:hypothetical protein